MNLFLYLQTRRIKNGFYRSFKTPVRAFMTVFLAAYLLFSFYTLVHVDSSRTKPVHSLEALDLHNPAALLTLFHVLILLYILPPPKYMYVILSETDVANLYPAPLERWRVFRFFLLTRGFLLMLLLVGIGAIYGSMALRVAIPGIIPPIEHGTDALWRILYVAWVVIAIAGMLFWRLALDMLREFGRLPAKAFRSIALVATASFVAVLLYHASIAMSAGKHPISGMIESADTFPFTFVLAPFRLLSDLLLRSADFSAPSTWICMAFWVGLAGSGYRMVRFQGPLLYDYAARLAAFRTQMVARWRNPAAALKEKADKGKMVFELPWFLKKMDPRRAGAIFWRDMIVTWRSYDLVVKWLHGLLLIAVVAAWFAVRWYHVPLSDAHIWGFGGLLLALPVAPLCMVSVTSMAEILRRIEIQKPLPIRGLQTVGMHILQWTASISSITFLPFIAGAFLFSAYWHIILFLIVAGWSYTHLFVSAGFLVALFNPDQNDPVQRMYSGLFGLFAMVISLIPGAIVLVPSFLLHLPKAIILVLLVLVNGATAWFFHYLAARKYANFVFTE
jgi:hypothetical protein